jgi:hypothetical protein
MVFHSPSVKAYRMAESSFSELESRNHANHQLETGTSGFAPEADLTGRREDYSD